PEHNDARAQGAPVINSNAGDREKRESRCCNNGADDKWKFSPITRNESARPAGKEKQAQNKRKQRSTGSGGRVALNLNQIHRQEKKRSAKRAIKKKRQQISTGEITRTKKRKRQHWISRSRFPIDKIGRAS